MANESFEREARVSTSNAFSDLISSVSMMTPLQPLQPIRQMVRPSSPQQVSDSTLDSTSHPTSDSIYPMDKCNPFARAGVIYTPPGASPGAASNVHEDLLKHMSHRFPKLVRTSKNLQRVMGTMCEDVHNVPAASAISPMGLAINGPGFRHLRNEVSPLIGSHPDSSASRGTSIHSPPNNLSALERTLRSSPAPRTHTQPVQATSFDSSQEIGLKETMLRHGTQPYGNQKKTELRSISFSDWSADQKTGNWANKFLGHFNGGNNGGRITMYEVDVPKPCQPLNTPSDRPLTDRWLWFTISLPVIDLSQCPDNFATYLYHTSPPFSTVTFAAPYTSTQYNHETFQCAPYESQNITVHPQINEDVLSRFQPEIAAGLETECGDRYPDCTGRRYPLRVAPMPNIIKCPRLDFDFIQNGTPSFEFTTHRNGGSDFDEYFRSIPALFSRTSSMFGNKYLRAEVKHCHFKKEALCGKNKENHSTVTSNMDNPMSTHAMDLDADGESDDEFVSADMIGPNGPYVEDELRFWLAVKEAARDDVTRWNKIRAAMSRGFCRVIARVEVEAANLSPAKRSFQAGIRYDLEEADELSPIKKRFAAAPMGGNVNGPYTLLAPPLIREGMSTPRRGRSDRLVLAEWKGSAGDGLDFLS